MSVRSLSLVLASADDDLIQLWHYSIVLVMYLGSRGPVRLL
jgi:hypothetical protein